MEHQESKHSRETAKEIMIREMEAAVKQAPTEKIREAIRKKIRDIRNDVKK